jgi:hypothetical protein
MKTRPRMARAWTWRIYEYSFTKITKKENPNKAKITKIVDKNAVGSNFFIS